MAEGRTDKKENKIFLICKEIQSGAVAKSYMSKGFQIYEEKPKYLTINEEVVSHIWLCNCSILNFLIYEDSLIFLSVRKGEEWGGSLKNDEAAFCLSYSNACMPGRVKC